MTSYSKINIFQFQTFVVTFATILLQLVINHLNKN
jgi:hypothetical protein